MQHATLLTDMAQQMEHYIAYCATRSILCPKNVSVRHINDELLDSLAADARVYTSVDSVAAQELDPQIWPTEYLNTIELPGFPSHKLKLKIGAVVMVIK